MPVTWCLAHPKLGEREVMAALLKIGHHLITTEQVILADKGFSGRDFHARVSELGAHLVIPPRASKTDPRSDPDPQVRRLLRVRQWIESIFDTLRGQLSPEPWPPPYGTTPRPANHTPEPHRLRPLGITNLEDSRGVKWFRFS